MNPLKQPKQLSTKPRQLKPVVKVSVKHCPCKQDHTLPVSKLMHSRNDGPDAIYQCPKLGWVKVERRVS